MATLRNLSSNYRYHFILKSPSREKLNVLLRGMLQHATGMKVPRTAVIIDVDAVSLM